ncbi:hypothetical protein CONLIGDRAFT_102221 [Coniochaeta ligniaria NRRL 30616]|uniref:Uncharacterized protein n=1 Tax=Coniochaeta ligniaria NRRL 30616 TaxID=1408157 RepID=A0A1J7J681_9PEZI|nr:hypothetical protein CONLIGDRAFT_102221 [Coniochaeta ligniaria NRRL 30616]
MASMGDQISLEAQRQVEAYYFEWKAGREQLQAQCEAAEKKEDFEYRKAIESVEAEFQRNMRVVEAGGPQSLDMLQQVMVDKRSLKLKALEKDYRETRTKMQNHFDKQLLEHTEKFSKGILDKMTPVANYNAPQLSTLSASRLPSSAAQPTTSPFYPSQTLGSNTDSRFSVPDHGRHPPQPAQFHGGDYARYNAQLRSFREGDYARHSSQPKLHDEYSTPVGPDRHPVWTNTPQSSNQVDARARHPLPSHQKILPSTPMVVQQERVMEPLNTTSSAKRHRDTQNDGQFEQGFPKRTRSFGAHGHSENNQIPPSEEPQNQSEKLLGLNGADKAKPPTPRTSQKISTVKRTIDFHEVYQDGDAEYKHMIIRYPPGDDGKGEWWILKCDEHGVHFNLNPLHGAAKHLHSNQHNNMSKEHSLAIRELGHMVWDCTMELAEKNNEAVKRAFENGYRPFNRNQLTKTERRSMGFADPETIPARKAPVTAALQRKKVAPDSVKIGHSKEFTGVVYPVDAELYLGYWSKNKTRYVVKLLPWGDLAPAGLSGTLKGTDLLDKPPKCYTTDRATGEITGWAEGYEDGGRLVTKREFPVMYFDGSQSVGWLRARDISLFNFEDPDSHSIPHYYDARNNYATIQPQKFENYQHMKDYYAANGLLPKLFSSVRQFSPSSHTLEDSAASLGADNSAVQSVDRNPGPDMDEDKSSRPGGPAKMNGHAGQLDVEMLDVPRADDTESYHDSAASDVLESDDDVEMGNAESRRTSVSNKGLGRTDGPSTTATTDKQPADPSAASRDVSAVAARAYAKTTAMASPRIQHSVENAGHDKDKETVPAVIQTTEDASITLKEAAGRVSSGRTNGASVRRESESSSSAGSDTRKVVKFHAHRSRSARASESPSLSAATLATTNGAALSPSSPRTKDSIIHKGLAPPQTNTSAGEPRSSPLLDVAKSPVSSIPQGEANTSHSEEPASLRVVHEASPNDQQPVQSVIAAQVTGFEPALASQMSDSSSSISSALSMSPTPVAAGSRTPTPTVLHPDEVPQANRWRAVRGDSGPEVVVSPQPQQSSSVASAATSSTSAPKELSKEAPVPSVGIQNPVSATSRTSTPFSSKMASEELFEIAYYEDDSGGKFHKQKDGPFLRVVVDKQANTCETTPGQSAEVKINPHDIARVDVNPLDDSPGAPCMVSLELKDQAKGPKMQQLVFETSKAMGREEFGRIHARRFCAWVKRVNAAIDYRNHTYNSSRPATSYTRN